LHSTPQPLSFCLLASKEFAALRAAPSRPISFPFVVLIRFLRISHFKRIPTDLYKQANGICDSCSCRLGPAGSQHTGCSLEPRTSRNGSSIEELCFVSLPRCVLVSIKHDPRVSRLCFFLSNSRCSRRVSDFLQPMFSSPRTLA